MVDHHSTVTCWLTEVHLSRLQTELMQLMTSPAPGVSAFPSADGNLMSWRATIDGPDDTPYAGLTFKLSFAFPANYPYAPPTVLFKTPIYHPNVDFSGRICLDILKDKWTPAYNTQTVLLSLQSLLGEPNKYVSPPAAVRSLPTVPCTCTDLLTPVLLPSTVRLPSCGTRMPKSSSARSLAATATLTTSRRLLRSLTRTITSYLATGKQKAFKGYLCWITERSLGRLGGGQVVHRFIVASFRLSFFFDLFLFLFLPSTAVGHIGSRYTDRSKHQCNFIPPSRLLVSLLNSRCD